MRILITALNYAPEFIGAGRYTTQIAEHLAGRGHEVSVVTAPPHYPRLRVYEGYSARRYSREEIGGVEVVRCPAWNPSRLGAWPRVLRDASFAAFSAGPLLGAIRARPDVVMAVAPSILSAFPAYAAARLYGARSVLHVQDLEINAAMGLSMLPEWALKAAITPEGWLMRRFDRVIAVSSEMAAEVGNGRRVGRVSILRNWADIAANGQGAARTVREMFGIDEDCVVVLYSGSIGRKQGLDTLVRAAGLTGARKICFVVCAEGPGMDELKQAASDAVNIRFLPLQDEKSHRLLLCRADIHLILQRGGACGAFMPSKLANICSCGGALICAADRDCELSRMVESAGGMIVDAESPEALSRALDELAGDGQRRREMGRRARRFAGTYFDKQSALTILESLIASCPGENPACEPAPNIR